MQTFHEAVGAVETFSPAEEQFNRRRRTAGLFAAPAIFLILLYAPMGALPVPAHRMAAVMGLVVTLWLTEALPLAVTAILGSCLAVVMGVASGSGANGSRDDFDEGSLDELLAGWAVAERIVVARRTDSTG